MKELISYIIISFGMLVAISGILILFATVVWPEFYPDATAGGIYSVSGLLIIAFGLALNLFGDE